MGASQIIKRSRLYKPLTLIKFQATQSSEPVISFFEFRSTVLFGLEEFHLQYP